ncbi:MAG: hypothetical protein ACPIOQ_23905 [Promethearchaeia archaeon]
MRKSSAAAGRRNRRPTASLPVVDRGASGSPDLHWLARGNTCDPPRPPFVAGRVGCPQEEWLH